MFNPNLPAHGAPIVSQELRDQFNALKALIDAQQTVINTQAAQIAALQSALAAKASMDDVNAAITANSSANCNNIDAFSYEFSDPPTKNDLDAFVYGVNQLITALHRPS